MRLARLLWEYRDPLFAGIGMTVLLSVLAMVISLMVGLLLARCHVPPALDLGPEPTVRRVWAQHADHRAADLGALCLAGHYRAEVHAFYQFLIALTLQTSGYLAEEYRGGIEGDRPRPRRGGALLGLTRRQVMRLVVLPQAVVRIIPGLLNQFVTCFKSTSIVSVIAVPDLMYQAGLIVSETFVAMPVYSFTALIYFLLVLGVSAGVGQISQQLPGSAGHRADRG